MRIAVVIAGGVGERFWPLSSPERPKQLLRLTSDTETMLEEAVFRIRPLVGEENVYIATSQAIGEAVRANRIISEDHLLVEPARRNTLGALCWIAAQLLAQGAGDATVATLTADHAIGNPEEFRLTIRAAMEVAESTCGIVTIGVMPTRAETGYGYLEIDRGTSIKASDGRIAHPVMRFREKPDQTAAEEYVASGRFLWNSGMFFYRLSAFLDELESAQPAAHRVTLSMAKYLGAGRLAEAAEAFLDLPNISIDYAVMERAKKVEVIEAGFAWDDVGSWDALERTFKPDENGNVLRGQVVTLDSTGNLVVVDNPDYLVATLGVRDLVVVVSAGKVLICDKRQAQRVREIALLIASQP